DKEGRQTPQEDADLQCGLRVIVGEKENLEQVLKALTDEWEKAILSCDSATLRRLAADDFTLIPINGGLLPISKEDNEEAAAFMSFRVGFRLPSWTGALLSALIEQTRPKLQRVATDEVKVRIYGQVAVVTGRTA